MNMNKRARKWRKSHGEIDPDEVLIDSSNLPEYDTDQFEGRLEKPISKWATYSVGVFFIVIALVFLSRAIKLQVVDGAEYAEKSEKNMLRPTPIFAGRGVLTDRNGTLLAWNAPADTVASTSDGVTRRQYATSTGLSHVLGYVQYPSKDSNGYYYREDFQGIAGAEKYFDAELQGNAGSRLIEVDAMGHKISESIVRPPVSGDKIVLSIDSRVQSELFHNIKDIAERVGFAGGAGIIMDVKTGELIALTSYPEYSSQVMSDRDDVAAVKSLLNNPSLPFLDRAVDGLYTPGSIVKPYIALGALNENVIDADTVIVTTGSISIPNPYDDTKSTIFRDWKNNGALDMRKAIAMSSDAYFYTIGGGYKDQKGLGVRAIDAYLRLFGFGATSTGPTGSFLFNKAGTIPTPEWKQKTFKENWYLGDTYNTSIGQYGFQVTPIQIIRAVSTLANGGVMISPTILHGQAPVQESLVDIPQKYFTVVKEGMRQGVLSGTVTGLNVPYVHIAGKSGTAELGVAKDKVNSWITGFWPYENPKYAFVVMLEKGSVHNLIGAVAAMRQQIEWMKDNTPEYFQ
jgi:penicillin-binding protein 2